MEEKKMSAREQAIQAIKEGGSVFVGGVQYTLSGNPDTGALPLAKLPSEAEFAKGDPEAEKRALGNIQEEIKRLEEARKSLEAAQKENKAAQTKQPEPSGEQK